MQCQVLLSEAIHTPGKLQLQPITKISSSTGNHMQPDQLELNSFYARISTITAI